MAGVWRPHGWGIRAKIVAVGLAYVLALSAVYAAFTVSLVRREAARAQDRLQLTASLVGAELDAYLEAGRERLATVAHLPGMIYGLPNIREASGEGRIPPWTTLHYLFFKSPVFTGGALLLDRDGKVLWTEPPGRPWIGRTLTEDPLIARAYASRAELVSGGLSADALFDRPHALLTAPIRDSGDAIQGVLGGIIDLTAPEFTKILHAVSTREGRFIDVVDQNGRVIARNSGEPPEQANPASAAAGDEWMVAATPLSQAPWQVRAGQPRDVALADVWQAQRLLFILGLGLLALAVAVGSPLVNGFVRAIRTLTEAAEVMASGDLSRPVHVGQRQDELATLARSFEQMRIELARSRAALERRLEEREELIRLKEAFLAGISHELRTPLNAILGYTEMLNDEPLGPDGRDYLTTVRAQSEHLLRMVSDLLTLSGLNTGTLAVEVSPVRVAAIVARLQPLADRLRTGTDVEVVWDCPAALPILETDPLRLEQILTNLLTNAFKFTAHGRVVVRVRQQPAGERVSFEVSDTGIGIAAHELPHIFDEFRQLDGSLTRCYGGVGLGLALVKRLAELLHGDVAVQSQPGGGSTFIVTLPLRIDGSAAAAAAA